MSLSLSEILKKSYKSNEDAKKALLKYNYVLDKSLSNDNQKVFYNPKTKKLLVAVAGTHNLKDGVTDVYLAAGKLKETNRYKEAKRVLETARKLYPSASKNVDIVGHSLGGSIASRIGKNKDRIQTYNKGSTIGERIRENEKSYRTEGDVVSILAPNTSTIEKTVKNLRANQMLDQQPTFFKSHNIGNLGNIFIPDTKERPELIYDPNAGDSVEFQNYGLDE
jgi:hypothetical protein